MASINAEQKRVMAHDAIQHSKHVYANIEPDQKAAKDSMHYLGQDYDNLSTHHRQFLRVKRKVEPKKTMYICNDKGELVLTDFPMKVKYGGHWNLFYQPRKIAGRSPYFTMSMGTGSPGQEDRGVDIMVAHPDQSPNGVLPIHALLRIHPRSSLLMIGGVSDSHPVQLITDRVTIFLGAGDWHGLSQTRNTFRLNEMDFSLNYRKLSQEKLDDLREARDESYKLGGFPAPDPRLPLFPHNPIGQMGDIVHFQRVGRGTFGEVYVAMNIKTGEPCAVKEVAANSSEACDEFMHEAEVLFRFPGKPSVIQASHIFCKHEICYDTRSSGNVRVAFDMCPLNETFYVIQPLASGDFKTLDAEKYGSFRDLVKIIKGPLEGLKILHDDGYMHRDVTKGNMLVFADGHGALSDHGKALQAVTHTSNRTAPSCYRAPEVDGHTPYWNAADVWSAGIAISWVIFNDLHKWKDWNEKGSQSRAWLAQLHKKLDIFGKQSKLHEDLSILVKEMLTYNAHNRPSIGDILDRWPGKRPRGVDIMDDEGRPAKIPKTSPAIKETKSTLGSPPRQKEVTIMFPPVGCVNADWDFDEAIKRDLEERNIMQRNDERNVMRQVGGFTAVNHPQHQPHPTIQDTQTGPNIAVQDVGEEDSTEILSPNHSFSSAAGPNWDKAPPAALTADVEQGSRSCHTTVGQWTEVKSRDS